MPSKNKIVKKTSKLIPQKRLVSKVNFKDSRAVLENISIAIIVFDFDNIHFINAAAKKILAISDYKTKTPPILSLLDFISFEHHGALKKNCLLATKKPYEATIILTTQTKQTVNCEIKITPLKIKNKRAYSAMIYEPLKQNQQTRAHIAEAANIKLQEEIHERKKIEAELIQAQKFTRLLIDSSLDTICAADRTGKIIEFNAAAEKAFGQPKEAVLGKPLTILFLNPEDQRAVLDEMIASETSFTGEVLNRKFNGETFVSYLSATILKNEKGEIIGSMGISRDITHIKKDELLLKENDELYRAIYNQAFIGIARVDIYSGKFIEVNQRLSEILGYTKAELLTKSTFQITIKEDLGQTNNQDLPSLDGFFVLRRYIHANGSIVYMNLSYSLVKDTKNNPLYFVVVYHDVTKNKIYEQEILNQSAKIKAIFESTSHLIWTVNRDYELTSFNNNFIQTIKDKYKINPLLNRKLQDYLRAEEDIAYSNEWIPRYESVFNGNKKRFERRDTNGKGEEVFREVFLQPIYDEKNNIIEIACVAHDISERKASEKQIIEQSAQLKSIFDSSSHLIWTATKDLRVTSYNNNFFNIVKKNKSPFHNLKRGVPAINQTNPNYQIWIENYKKAFKGASQHFEVKSETNHGQSIWTEIFLEPTIDKSGSVFEVSGIAHDVTEKKKAESALKLSLKEKEVLLNEVHHRVKNNLQVISSILNLQLSHIIDKKTQDTLKECQHRIKSMAYVHESLYQNKDFSSINFSEYIITLSKNLLQSYGLGGNKVKLIFDVDKTPLNLDISIPCGLIINELITNALKYAFPNNASGAISVTLKAIKERVYLTISDNGVGFPKHINFRNTSSLGLQLVITLVEQIGGEIELNSGSGTKFLINFTSTKN